MEGRQLDQYFGTLPGSTALAALHQREEREANTARKAALQSQVEATLSKGAAITAAARKATKSYHAERVQKALLAAAKADPILDFSGCDCKWHEDAMETPNGLIASIVWNR